MNITTINIPMIKAFITNNILIYAKDSEIVPNYNGEYWKIVADVVIQDKDKVSDSRRCYYESKLLKLNEITDEYYHSFLVKVEEDAINTCGQFKKITEIPNKKVIDL